MTKKDKTEEEKNLGGRPPHYNTPEELQDKIDEYFKKGINKRKVEVGPARKREVIEIEIPTICGLAYYLGFESRQSFYDYEKREKFSYIVKRARMFIERSYEEMLQHGNTAGAIFALKNMGWLDVREYRSAEESETSKDLKKINEAIKHDPALAKKIEDTFLDN